MIRKIKLILLTLTVTISILGCGFFSTTSTQTTTFLTMNTTVSHSNATTSTFDQSSPFIPEYYDKLSNQLAVTGIPSTGDVKLLVFAVDFSDYPQETYGTPLSDISKAFNGLSSDLPYESLRSYYQKSSYGKLNLTADIYGYYRASHPASYYENENEKLYAWDDINNDWLYGEDEVTYPDSDLIYELLLYYDDEINYQDYDQNNDGYIDGIYILYTHPVSYETGSEFWWAYQDVYIYEEDSFDNVEAYNFVWSGMDFFSEGNEAINARTIIHETGHMLGLEDYYDYDTSDYINSGGLGGVDMMDNTYGDHNPFSKLLLGWIKPIVITSSMTVDITPYIESGEVLLLIDEWKNTLFDEYILISFYSPEGLNEYDKSFLFSESGILAYHVNATLGTGFNEESAYPSIYEYNNSDTTSKLISIIEQDMDFDIDNYGTAENSDLYLYNDSFLSTTYPNFEWSSASFYTNIMFRVLHLDIDKATLDIQIQP